MPKEVIQTQKPDYKYAGKETLTEIIKRTFPRQLIPTKRMGAIFGGLFLLAMLLAVFKFPLNSLISGNANVSIEIGYPYPFLDFGLTAIEESPLRIGGLAIDLILYLIISYLADILLTLALRNPFSGSKQAKKRPTVFKDKRHPPNTRPKKPIQRLKTSQKTPHSLQRQRTKKHRRNNHKRSLQRQRTKETPVLNQNNLSTTPP